MPRGWCSTVLVAALLCCAATLRAQHPPPHPGPWHVTRSTGAAFGRWRPAGDSLRPLVLMVGERPAGEDTLFAAYLASQGFDVFKVDSRDAAALLSRVATGEQSQAGIAILGYGGGVSLARELARNQEGVRALIEVDPPPGTSGAMPGIARLVFRPAGDSAEFGHPGAPPDLLVRRGKEGARVTGGIVHAFLDFTLRGLGETPSALADRLRAAGLAATAGE